MRPSDAPEPKPFASPLRDVLSQICDQLAAAGIVAPAVDAELLAGHVLGLSRGEVQAAVVMGKELAPGDADALAELAARRASREPLQHIVGWAGFRTLTLSVGPGVFVPRPETETVAQLAIDALRSSAAPQPLAVDLCTGSGAIALALAVEVPHALVIGVERSADAFVWAKENVRALGVDNARIIRADLSSALPEADGRVDVVVSNPPYVPDDAVPRDPEVQLFDPPEALYGGADGLDVVRALSVRALHLLRPGGVLVIEHGEWQGASIRDLLRADGWQATATHPDLTMRDRATTALRP